MQEGLAPHRDKVAAEIHSPEIFYILEQVVDFGLLQHTM
jgi:hypothetical protein